MNLIMFFIGIVLGSWFSFMFSDKCSASDLHLAENAAKEYNRLARRLKYDSYTDLEITSTRMETYKTEFLVYKPWYAFWMRLEK